MGNRAGIDNKEDQKRIGMKKTLQEKQLAEYNQSMNSEDVDGHLLLHI